MGHCHLLFAQLNYQRRYFLDGNLHWSVFVDLQKVVDSGRVDDDSGKYFLLGS